MLVGFSKTGMPGAGIPAVAFMAEAFRDRTQLSIGALLPILLVGDLFALAYYRRHAHWRRLAELSPYVLAGMVPGYFVLQAAEGDSLRILLGAIILALLTLQVLQQYLSWQPRVDRRWLVGAVGSLAGFGTMVGNAAGPVMSIYLVGQRLEKQELLGTAAWFFFLVNFTKLAPYASLGMITPETLKLDAMLVPVVVAGALTGVAFAKRISQRLFNLLVLVLAAIAAVRLIAF